MKAGARLKDITPKGKARLVTDLDSAGVHDPLFARVLVLDDETGNSAAIVCLDLPGIDLDLCDELSEVILSHTGIHLTLINCSHTHSAPGAAATSAAKAIPEAVDEACKNMVPVSLRAGRAPVQIGFNRRTVDDDGQVRMEVNMDGAVVPWVNVLVAERLAPGNLKGVPLAVLFEHAAHPVVVHQSSDFIGADYPGEAVRCIQEQLGEAVMPMFAQGCGGNVNAYPLQGGYEKCKKAGRKLGDAALRAMGSSEEIKANKLRIRSESTTLRSQDPPSMEMWRNTWDLLEQDAQKGTESGKPVSWVTPQVCDDMRKALNNLKMAIQRGDSFLPRWFDAHAVMLGSEWCLISTPHELFCEYELWATEQAPFKHCMVLGYTNGNQGYVATDEALAMGPKGGYEAGSYPCWWSHGAYSPHGPLAVGAETRIKTALANLWR